jgi:hypothetical protein
MPRMTITLTKDLQTRSARLRPSRPIGSLLAEALGFRNSFRLIRG